MRVFSFSLVYLCSLNCEIPGCVSRPRGSFITYQELSYSRSSRPRDMRWLIILASSSPFCRTTSSERERTCTLSADATIIRRPSADHFNLFSPRPDPPSGSTTIPSDPVIGSSSELARFQRPTVPLLEAVAHSDG